MVFQECSMQKVWHELLDRVCEETPCPAERCGLNAKDAQRVLCGFRGREARQRFRLQIWYTTRISKCSTSFFCSIQLRFTRQIRRDESYSVAVSSAQFFRSWKDTDAHGFWADIMRRCSGYLITQTPARLPRSVSSGGRMSQDYRRINMTMNNSTIYI